MVIELVEVSVIELVEMMVIELVEVPVIELVEIMVNTARGVAVIVPLPLRRMFI
jgi:hypothetical protein